MTTATELRRITRQANKLRRTHQRPTLGFHVQRAAHLAKKAGWLLGRNDEVAERYAAEARFHLTTALAIVEA